MWKALPSASSDRVRYTFQNTCARLVAHAKYSGCTYESDVKVAQSEPGKDQIDDVVEELDVQEELARKRVPAL